MELKYSDQDEDKVASEDVANKMKKLPKPIKALETQSGAQFDFTQQLLDRVRSF